MSTLYIVRGLPGSGKSTFAKKLQCFHIEADMFYVRNGLYQFDPSRVKEGHDWCMDNIFKAFDDGIDVCVSNTFTTLNELYPYLYTASMFGYNVEIYTLTADYGSVHGVPEETIQKMRDRWENIEGEIII